MRACGWLILTLFFVSCCTTDKSTAEYGPDAISISGTMKLLPLEGGCWQFLADDGSTYQISGGDRERLFHDGLRAVLIVGETSGLHSVCMAGKTVRLIKIVKLY